MQKSGKLELTWVGKYEQKEIEPRILVENPELSYGDQDTGNMLIHGDNLIALKALEQDYAGKSSVFISIHLIIQVVLLNTMTMGWNIVNG